MLLFLFHWLEYFYSPFLLTLYLLLKDTPTSYIINTTLSLGTDKFYDYFQFAELMKENNPDLYDKLKIKYKFEIITININKEVINFLNF